MAGGNKPRHPGEKKLRKARARGHAGLKAVPKKTTIGEVGGRTAGGAGGVSTRCGETTDRALEIHREAQHRRHLQKLLSSRARGWQKKKMAV